MKRIKKCICLLLSLVIMLQLFISVNLSAFAVSMESDFTYVVLDDRTAQITEYTGTEGNVVIPATIDGYNVTVVGEGAFYNKDTITELIIPEGVVLVKDQAFWGCNNLKSLTFPKSLIQTYKGAFGECTALTDVYYQGTEEEWKYISFYDGYVNGVGVGYDSYLLNAMIHYSGFQESIQYGGKAPGAGVVEFGANIVGYYVGDMIETYVVYRSKTHNITSLNISSSNTDIVEIEDIKIGVGVYGDSTGTPDYDVTENTHIATVLLVLKSKGSSTITIVGPEGVSESIEVIVEAEEPIEPEKPEKPIEIIGFNAKRDGWSIINFNKSFGYSDDYRLPISSYYATDITFSSIVNSILNRKWNGSCFGLSLLAIAEYNGQVDLKGYFDNTGDTLNLYGYQTIINTSFNSHNGNIYTLDGNDEIIKAIERAQASQYSAQIAKAEVFKWDNDYSELLSYLNEENSSPLIITMNLGANGGHAIVTDTSIKPIDCGNGRYIIMCYDSNSPQLTNEIENQWDIYSYEQSYVLLDTTDGRWWYYYNGKTDGYMQYNFMQTRYIRFYDVSKLETEFFYGDYTFEKDCATNFFDSTNFALTDKESGEIIFEINDNIPVLYTTEGEYYPYCESATGENESAKGCITVPYCNYQLENIGEANITQICESYIVSYYVDDAAVVDLSREDANVTVSNVNEDSPLKFKIVIQDFEGDGIVTSEGCIEKQSSITMCVDFDAANPTAVVETDSDLALISTSLYSKNQVVEKDFHKNKEKKTVSGTIDSVKNKMGNSVVRLLVGEEVIAKVETTENKYEFTNISPGAYTLEVNKTNHTTRTYEIIVKDSDVVQDVEIHLLGDINGDGEVTVADYGKALAHVRKTSMLEGYLSECADVNSDGKVTVADYGKILAHVRKTTLLW